ncbi:MAG: deoxyribonuclease IV [Candidatus Margulisbacteria bacterium]|nr:deoxyribonuclease IV [Candidatus Margulisiibacteriota bacterium]
MLLGAHMSIAGGVDKAIERGLSIGCAAIQIFVKNNNQWAGKPLSGQEIERFKTARKQSGIFVFAHAGYLINLATPLSDNLEKSHNSMIDELERCEALGLPFIVLHPGSHLGKGEGQGIGLVIKHLNELIKQTKGFQVKIALETTAGQGTNLGYKFAHLAEILSGIKEPERLAVCFDTCHSFAAGYDLKTPAGYRATWEEFDRTIGLDKLIAFHLNDSLKGLGSKLDRHEHIGRGELGLEPFRFLMNDKRFENLPMVLETPKGPEMKEDFENIKILRGLIDEKV